MHTAHFDIVFLGDSLAARMGAALTAKHGRRVLLLTTPFHIDPWQHASLFVDSLINALGSRDLVPAARRPFQVLSGRARIAVDPALPLADELAREFGGAAAAVGTLLDEFERTGTFLAEMLWRHGGLPAAGLRGALAWRWLCLRHQLPLATLARPLAGRLQGLPGAAGEWLTDLFQGLSLQPLADLTVADAALLWADALRPGAMNGEELLRLLHKRFEQFHGTELRIDEVESLRYTHGHWSATLPGGRHFQAEQLVLGDLGQALPGGFPLPQHALFPPPGQFRVAPIDGQFSSLLANRVIVGGARPLRLSIVTADGRTAGEISCGSGTDEMEARRQLEPVLPFFRQPLEAEPASRRPPAAQSKLRPSLFRLPLHLGNHLWCVDETRLAPQLGSGGAALLAWSLARHLAPTLDRHGD